MMKIQRSPGPQILKRVHIVTTIDNGEIWTAVPVKVLDSDVSRVIYLLQCGRGIRRESLWGQI
jgi:hypothetical protein